jgi:hypothetical protein
MLRFPGLPVYLSNSEGEASMKIADVSINRPVFAIMMSLALVTLGTFSYRTLGVDLMPKTDQPQVDDLREWSPSRLLARLRRRATQPGTASF